MATDTPPKGSFLERALVSLIDAAAYARPGMHAEGGSNGRVEDRSQLVKLC